MPRLHRSIYQLQAAEREEEFVVQCLRGGVDDVLEIGCGTGRFTRHLAAIAKRVVAVDNNPHELAAAKLRLAGAPHVAFVHSAIGSPPALPGHGKFSAVVAMRVLPHIDNWEDTLGWLLSAVRPGGFLLFDLWNRRSFNAWWQRVSGYRDPLPVHRLTPPQIGAAIAALPAKKVAAMRWGYPHIGPWHIDDALGVIAPAYAYSTTFCLRRHDDAI